MAYIPTKPKSVGASGKYKSTARLSGGVKVKSGWGSGGVGIIPEFDDAGKPTGRYGFGGSGVTAVYGQTPEMKAKNVSYAGGKSGESLIAGTFTDVSGTTTKSYSLSNRVIPSDASTGRSDYNPRRDAFFNANKSVNPVSDSGIIYNPRYRVSVSPSLYNKYIKDEYGADDSKLVRSGGVVDEAYVNSYTGVSGRFISFAGSGDSAYMDSGLFQLRDEYGGTPYPYRAGIILADIATTKPYLSEARSINVFGGGISEFPSRVYQKALLNFKGTLATPIFSTPDKSVVTIGLVGNVLGGFAGDVVSGYSRFFGFAGRNNNNVGVGSDSSLFGTFPELKGSFEGFTKDFFNYGEVEAKSYFVSDANSWGELLSDRKVRSAGVVTGLGLLSVVSPVASAGIKWGMAGYGGFTGVVGYKTNNPEMLVAGAGMLLLSKPFERALYNPVSVKGSEFFGLTTKPENLNMNFVEDFTIPKSLKELRGFEGRSASTISVSDANPYGLFGKSFDVVKTEGRAEGWRANLDLFGLYKSSPSVDGSSNVYLAYGMDFGKYSEMPKDFRFGKGVVNVLDFRNDFISSNVRGNNLKGVVNAQKYYGGTYIPAQNVFGMSNEGQFVSPVGTRISKTGEPVTYSFYRQSNPYASDTSFFGRVKGVAWDVGSTITGSKYSLLRVIPSKTIPVIDVMSGARSVGSIDRLGARSSGGVVSLSYPSVFSLPVNLSRSSFRSFSVPSGISGFGSSSRVSSGYSSSGVSSLGSYSSFMSSSGLSSGFGSSGSSGGGSSRSSGLSSSIVGSGYSSSGVSGGYSGFSSSGLSSGGSSTIGTYFPSGLGGFGGSKKSDFLSGVSFNPEYVGSVLAGDRRLFGKKPSGFSVSSGLAVRPLLRIKSGRRRI